jgi:hypothetical protein
MVPHMGIAITAQGTMVISHMVRVIIVTRIMAIRVLMTMGIGITEITMTGDITTEIIAAGTATIGRDNRKPKGSTVTMIAGLMIAGMTVH